MNVLLITERPEQLTGSDCCGKIEGDFAVQGGVPVFVENHDFLANFETARKQIEEEIGQIITVSMIDSRNLFGIWWKAIQFLKHKDLTFYNFIRVFFLLFSVPTVIINGQLHHVPFQTHSIYQLFKQEI